MSSEDVKRKLSAILSADVQGYSRLMGEDEKATVETITAYRKVMTDLIQTHHGSVKDAKGDNVLAEFPSVVDAIQCAVEIQKALEVRNADLPENRKMMFRVDNKKCEMQLGSFSARGESRCVQKKDNPAGSGPAGSFMEVIGTLNCFPAFLLRFRFKTKRNHKPVQFHNGQLGAFYRSWFPVACPDRLIGTIP
jgi:hypothetical protein